MFYCKQNQKVHRHALAFEKFLPANLQQTNTAHVAARSYVPESNKVVATRCWMTRRRAPGALDRHETTDGDHGRIEVRRHAVSCDVAWLATDRRHPGEPRFPGLKTIAMVEAEVERAGQTSIARRYYLSSAEFDAVFFARAVRAHWGIENRLHWVLDVVFQDDLARLRAGYGPENMATVRHMAMNLVRQAQPTTSLKNRRKKAAWSTD